MCRYEAGGLHNAINIEREIPIRYISDDIERVHQFLMRSREKPSVNVMSDIYKP